MPRILYVEDNDDNIYMLTRRLTRKGYEVVVARDGEAGVEVASVEMPDLILMDLGLPVIDGWEATRRLKQNPATAGIPIIALSAHAMDGDRDSAIAAGCDEFETKPVQLDQLLHKMQTLLARSSPEQA
jgi:two-component system cell cycle response regulator DivK